MTKDLTLNKSYSIQLEDGSKHIVRILEFNETSATVFFIMEWIACVKVLSRKDFKII